MTCKHNYNGKIEGNLGIFFNKFDDSQFNIILKILYIKNDV